MEGLPPWYASPALRSFVARRIVQPLRHPELYHPVTGTLPWAHAIYGREGLGKGRVLQGLLAEHGVSEAEYELISVKVGQCTAAMQTALCTVVAVQERRQPSAAASATKPEFIIIFDHADILCYEADNEQSMLDAVALTERCAKAGVMVVALFDRVPGELTADRASNFVRHCHNAFFAQFAHSVCYAAAPSEEYRERLMQWAVATFSAHVNGRLGSRIVVDLSDDNYKELCMLSTWTTPAQILDWLNKSFQDLIEQAGTLAVNGAASSVVPQAPKLNMLFLTRFNNTQNTPNGPHIVRDDLQAVESRFSEACGCGPVGGFVPSRDMPFKVPDPKITTFSEANADPDVARESLNKKRAREPAEGADLESASESALKTGAPDRDDFADRDTQTIAE